MVDVAWADVLTGAVGGLALFLLGIQQLTRALQNVAGTRLRALLLRVSQTPGRGALTGAVATGVIQSSTATVVLIVGFVAAGAMTLSRSVAVVLGANVGTTITIQVIAFDVTRFALLMIAVGFAVTMVRRFEVVHGPGRALMALGLVFFGMDVMAGAVAPLRDTPAVLDVFATGGSLAVGLVVGALFTAVIQSSSATSGILIVLASQGLLDLRMGIAVLMGASIGTCITPLLAGLGTRRAGLRVAVIHALVNIVGVSIWVWFIPQLAAASIALSPSSPDLTGAVRLAAETPRQLANAYTIFKVANLLLFVGLTRQVARVVERLVPDRPDDDRLGARYLDEDALETPGLALELARRELVHLGDETLAVIEAAMPTVLHGSDEELDALAARDRRVDAVHEDLLDYLGHIGLHELSESQTVELFAIISMASDLESIGDIVEVNLVQLGKRRLAEGVLPSRATTEVVNEFHATVVERLRQVVAAIEADDKDTAREIVDTKQQVTDQRHEVIAHLTKRLRADAPNRIRSYEREVEVVGQLQRIAGLTRHMARTLAGDRDLPGAADVVG